jgi:uncharacterized protein (DUF924 family)
MNTLTSIEDLLDFWFGSDDPAQQANDSASIAQRQAALWWGKDEATDRRIQSRFESTLQAAANQQLDHWADTPHGMLALILLFDQLPRNCYRNSATAFRFDELARQCCHLGLAQGFDQQLTPLQRVFFYLPLEHSEDIDDQQYSLQLFRALAKAQARDEPAAKATFDNYLQFANQHHAIIERFERFPHRNTVLGRPSTAAETAFLKEPNSSF